MDQNKAFPQDFIFGSATSALQIEGAFHEDGRGESVWDEFALKQGKGDESYHHLDEDVALLKELGVKAYRFSISWTRLFPEGTGTLNEKGCAYYLQLVHALRKAGIEPYVTLFHWDYPLALEKQGGWLNPHAPEWFEAYARAVGKLFDGLVFHYFTINEPQCFVELGYSNGEMAPWKKLDRESVLKIAQSVLVGNGLACRALRAASSSPIEVAMAHTYAPAFPKDPENPSDVEAARQANFIPMGEEGLYGVSYWCDPIFLGHYNEDYLRNFHCGYIPPSSDLSLIQAPFDSFGINIYFGYPVSMKQGKPIRLEIKSGPKNSLDWDITPAALYWGPKFLYERYGKPIFITENGTTLTDRLDHGVVHDPIRIRYIHDYLSALSKAISDGTKVKGYFYWSLLDNLEWANGFVPRFGLVYSDYATESRYRKDSFYYYKTLIATHNLPILKI
jgi:beta-glucosidase